MIMCEKDLKAIRIQLITTNKIQKTILMRTCLNQIEKKVIGGI